MRESHTCGSKIVTSRIQTNFSHLTGNSECNCLKTDYIKIQLFFHVRKVVRTSSELFNNAQDWKPLEIVAGPVLRSSKIFLHLWLSSEAVGKSSEVVGNLRWSSEVFRNLRQCSEAVGKSSEIQILWRQKISRILLKKSWHVEVLGQFCTKIINLTF